MDKRMRKLIFEQAKEWVLQAGKNIREKINHPLHIDTKANENDLVTVMDKETEKYFANNIKHTYPNHLLLAEEGYGDNVATVDGTVWIIDPIDGTMNFVHLKKDFAISVGIYHDGIGEIGIIYDVMDDVLFTAMRGEGLFRNGKKLKPLKTEISLSKSIFSFNHDLLCESERFNRDMIENLMQNIRGTRIIGAAAIDITQVAEGRVEAFIADHLSPWDIAAGKIILEEVGGIISRSNGKELNILESGPIFACNKAIHRGVVEKYLSKW